MSPQNGTGLPRAAVSLLTTLHGRRSRSLLVRFLRIEHRRAICATGSDASEAVGWKVPSAPSFRAPVAVEAPITRIRAASAHAKLITPCPCTAVRVAGVSGIR